MKKEVQLFNNLFNFNINLRATQLTERSSLFVDDDGNRSFNDRVGQFSFPEWAGRLRLRADVDDWRFTWQIRYTGAVEQDLRRKDPLSDTISGGSETCGGPTLNDVQCRDVGFAKEQFIHTASVRYSMDTWTFIAGVTNIFDKAPPLVDPTEVLQQNNVAIGSGYDYDGREFFFNVRKKF